MKKVLYSAPNKMSDNPRPWTTVKVAWSIRMDQEVEHYVNLLSLHFGLSKNNVAIHAINRLWAEVAPTIRPADLQDYEAKLKKARLFRLKKNEVAARKLKDKRLKQF